MTQLIRWHIYRDTAALCERAAAAILRSAAEAIAARGEFRLVLAGGETPRAIYAELAGAQADWQRWGVFFGDERVAEYDDPARNSVMAGTAWLDRQPAIEVYPIHTELGAEASADAYRKAVRNVRFDLVLLGLGEDGHTASLFDLAACASDDDVIVVNDAPKPPSQRVSLTPRCLSRTAALWFLVSGTGKRVAVARWRGGEAIPAATITPAAGVDVLIDQQAYS